MYYLHYTIFNMNIQEIEKKNRLKLLNNLLCVFPII